MRGSTRSTEQLRRPTPSTVYRQRTSDEVSGWSVRRRRLASRLLALMVLGLVWRLARYSACPPLWGDEAFLAVSLLTRDFAGLLRPLDYFQIAPIGFLGVELVVERVLGASEWALRLVPFLAGIASLILFERLARRVVDRRSGLVAVGIFAASYYPVRHATEVKPYATDLLLSILATSLAWSIVRDPEKKGQWLRLAGLMAFGVWFSYPIILVGAGLAMVLAVQVYRARSRSGWVGLGAFGLIASASWLTLYFGVAQPEAKVSSLYSELTTWQGAFPPLAEPWLLPLWLVDVHTGNMLAYPNGGNNFASAGTTLLVIAGAWTLRKSRPALLAILFSPLVPTFLASSLHRYPYGTSARISLYMAPAFCLIAGVGAVSILRRWTGNRRRNAYRLTLTALSVMIGVATVSNVVYPYKNWEDSENRRAVSELVAQTGSGDRLVVFDGLEVLPELKKLMLVHWLQQRAEVKYNILAKAPVPVLWMPPEGELGPKVPGRTWLVVHRSGCPDFDEVRLDRLKLGLTRRLGTPRSQTWNLTLGESIEAFEFPPSPDAL